MLVLKIHVIGYFENYLQKLGIWTFSSTIPELRPAMKNVDIHLGNWIKMTFAVLVNEVIRLGRALTQSNGPGLRE